MALDIDKTKVGRRSNRLGSGPRKAFRSGRPSRGVMPLNQGASSLGARNVMKLGGKAGGFGSGRLAGGAGNLAAALAGIGLSVTGTPEVGPAPVDRPILPPDRPVREGPLLPSLFTPPVADQWEANVRTYPTSPFVTDPTQGAVPYGGSLWPTFAPTPEYNPLLWQLGQRRAF